MEVADSNFIVVYVNICVNYIVYRLIVLLAVVRRVEFGEIWRVEVFRCMQFKTGYAERAYC